MQKEDQEKKKQLDAFNARKQNALLNIEKFKKIKRALFQKFFKQKKKKLTRKKQLEKKQPSKPSKPRIASQLNQLNFGGAGLNWLSTEDLTDKLAGNMDDLIMTADTVDEIPTLKRSAELNYPESARNSGTQGYVTISFIVTKNGKVKKPSVTKSEPAGIFESYALASIKNWEFNPAKFEGEAVQVWSQQTIRFDLN